MDFRLLGLLEVVDDGVALVIGPAKIRTLLAVLLLHPNQVVSAERLIDALWGERPPASAANTLQGYVSQLRKLIEPPGEGASGRVLRTHSPGYLVAVPAEQIDAFRFERLTALGLDALARSDFEGASRTLRDALALWRGPALADFVYEEFAQGAITRLEELRLSATEDYLAAQLGLGRHAEVAGELQSLVARHPLRERLRAQLMTALYRTGRHADALASYQQLRTMLAEELGLEPSPELVQLEEAILLHKPELAWRPDPAAIASPAASAAPAVSAAPARPAAAEPTVAPATPVASPAIPLQLSSFVGRDRELSEVRRLLSTTRLLTLTGAGGSGKTRLALEAASRYGNDGLGPVAVLELAAVTDGRAILDSLAAAAGAREQPGRSLLDTILDRLAPPGTLLVMDNCEHLLDDAALLVERLLGSAPALRVLATSREPLRVAGETTWRVPSLTTPDSDELPTLDELAGYEAVRLFVERATSATPEFRLTPENAAAVAHLCRRLDGMPLALELAAARTRSLAAQDLADRLDDRFRLLAGTNRRAPARHQTLRAAIDWSYDVLSDEERTLLNGLSVFAGRFTLAACEAVCATDGPAVIPVVLSALVDKSLVVVENSPDGCDYRLLETVREYAAERLAETGGAGSLRQRHAAYYLRVAEESESRLKGPDVAKWLRRLELDLDNLRAAFAHLSGRGDADRALRIPGALRRFFYLKGHYERGLTWLEEALAAAPTASAEARARALYAAGTLQLLRCEYEGAAASCTEALRLYRELGDRAGAARSLTVLGSVARERGELDAALALHDQALVAFSEEGDTWNVAHSLQLSGLALWLRGDYDAAAAASHRSNSLFEGFGDDERRAWAQLNLAAVALYQGEMARAQELLDGSLALFQRVGFKEGVAWTLNLLGVLALYKGTPEQAEPLLEESLAVHVELGDRWREASVLEALAAVRAARGRLAEAAGLLDSAERLRARIGAPVPPCERPDYERTRAVLARGTAVAGGR